MSLRFPPQGRYNGRPMMSEVGRSREVSSKEVKKVVKHATNQVYEPVVFTAEVAEELGVPEEVAYEALESCSYVTGKEMDGVSVWW